MSSSIHVRTLIAIAGFFVSIAGCSSQQGILGVDRCADVPSGAVPELAGTKICRWHDAQVRNAFGDQMVLYQCDFVGRTAELSPSAKARLIRRISFDNMEERVWVIESSSDDSIDQNRVQSVLNQLATLGATQADVVIGSPPALGLRGPQAERTARSIGGQGNSISGSTGGIRARSGIGGF